MVPNSAPVVQIASAQPDSSRSVSSGWALGGEVEVVAEAAEQRVAHRPADEVQLVAGVGEAAAQLVGDGRDAHQFGDGAALGGGKFAGHGRLVGQGGGGGCVRHGIASLSVPVADASHIPAAREGGGRRALVFSGMTGRAEYGDPRSFDPDATVALPIMPAGVAGNSPTMALPTVGKSPQPPPPGEPPTPAPGDDSGAGSVARNSAMMAVGSMVSRATGFLRTAAIGAAIGAALVSDDYNLANTLPNMVYELLLGGVLASVVVPLLVRARTRDTDRRRGVRPAPADPGRPSSSARRHRGRRARRAAVHRAAEQRPAPPAGRPRLITTLAYLLLPEIFFYGMAALFAAILNTRGHFAAPMWTPILNNVVVIATAGVFMLLPTVGDKLSAATMTATQIGVLGVGTTLGHRRAGGRAAAGAAPGRVPLAVAVGLPRAAPARAGPGQRLDARRTSWSARSAWSSLLKIAQDRRRPGRCSRARDLQQRVPRSS